MSRLFVLGSGIGYSLSPKIFGLLYKFFGQKGSYDIVDIPESELKNIRLLAEGAIGFNVTKPFKEKILPYLNSDLSGIGSVNTVKVNSMEGYSTDGDGFIFDLFNTFGRVGGNVLVIGYGGAAKACANALDKHGFNVFISGRNKGKAELFAAKAGVKLFDGDKINGVVSCTTETYIPDGLKEVEFCYDIRYNTPDVLKVGKFNANGLGMLVAQAIYSYGIFFDKQFDISDIKRVYCKLREAL